MASSMAASEARRIALRAWRIGSLINRAPNKALSLIEEARNEGTALGANCYEQAINRSPTPEVAWQVWNLMPDKSSRAATNMVLAYLRAEQLQTGVDFLTNPPPVEPLPTAWKTAFRRAAEAMQLETVNTLLKAMPENLREEDPVVLESLSTVFAELGELDELRTLLEQMADKQVNLTPGGCEKIMRRVAGHGDTQLALQIFERQRARRVFGFAVTPGMFDVVLNNMTYASLEDMKANAETLVDAYAWNGSWLNAQHVIQTLKANNLNPSDSMYRNLYKCVCRARLTTKAEEILGQMKDDGVLLVPEDYARLVRSYARVCKVTDAEKLVGDLLVSGPPPTSEVYNALLEVYVFAGRDDLAELLFKEVQAISETPGIKNLTLMVKLCTRQGRVADALQYFDAGVDLAAEGESRKSLYMALFEGFRYCGQLERARAHVEQKIGWDGEWPQILVKTYARSLEVTRAMEFLRDVLERGNPVGTSVFSALILAHGQILCHDAMWEVFEIAKRALEGTPIKLLNAMIRGYAASRNLKKAYEVFRMLGDEASMESYTALIIVHCKARDMVHAEKLVSAMTEQGMRMPVLLCNWLLIGYFNSRRVGDAEHLFAQMVAQGPTPNINTFQVMITGYGETGNVTRMKEIHRQVHEGRSRIEINVVTETAYMDGLLKNGLIEEAEQAFEAMKAHGPAPNVQTYGALINRYYKNNMRERAEETYFELKDAQCTVNGPIIFLMFKYRSLAGNWPGCFAILDEMETLQIAPNQKLLEYFRWVSKWESLGDAMDTLKRRLAPYLAEREQVPRLAEHPPPKEDNATREPGQLSESGLC